MAEVSHCEGAESALTCSSPQSSAKFAIVFFAWRFVADLLQDLEGQIAMPLSRGDWFNKSNISWCVLGFDRDWPSGLRGPARFQFDISNEVSKESGSVRYFKRSKLGVGVSSIFQTK